MTEAAICPNDRDSDTYYAAYTLIRPLHFLKNETYLKVRHFWRRLHKVHFCLHDFILFGQHFLIEKKRPKAWLLHIDSQVTLCSLPDVSSIGPDSSYRNPIYSVIMQ